MNANPEFASLARLVESLTPWLDQVVIIGGVGAPPTPIASSSPTTTIRTAGNT
jgi:hypothetical protein